MEGRMFGTNGDEQKDSLIREYERVQDLDNTGKLLQYLYKQILVHRDVLGYPEGCPDIPYLNLTNDLGKKCLMYQMLFYKHKDSFHFSIDEMSEIFVKPLELLLMAIDEINDGTCSKNTNVTCCSFYCSLSKEQVCMMIETLRKGFENFKEKSSSNDDSYEQS